MSCRRLQAPGRQRVRRRERDVPAGGCCDEATRAVMAQVLTRGIGRRRAARCAAALEDLDDDHAAAAARAWRAMVCRGAGGSVGVVALAGGSTAGIGRGDQLSGARDIGLAAGAGEQPVVADAVEPLGQDVEQEAPDELVGRRASSCGTAPARCGGSPCSGR